MKITKIFLSCLYLVAVFTFLSSCSEDDEAPSFDASFESSTASIAENAEPVSATILLPQGAQSEAVTVTYTLGGTAVEGTDYTVSPAGGSVVIPANATSVDVTITPVDNLVENDAKTVEISINEVSLGTTVIAQGTLNQTYTLTITDDECSPYIADTWNYEATYISISQGDGTEIPVGQNGQGLLSEFGEDGVSDNPDHEDGTPSIENPTFTGTVEIADPDNNRSYQILDAAVGQYAGLELTGPGQLLDDCGTLSTATGEGQPLVAGAFYITLTGAIVTENEITLTWNVSFDPEATDLVGKGSAILTR